MGRVGIVVYDQCAVRRRRTRRSDKDFGGTLHWRPFWQHGKPYNEFTAKVQVVAGRQFAYQRQSQPQSRCAANEDSACTNTSKVDRREPRFERVKTAENLNRCVGEPGAQVLGKADRDGINFRVTGTARNPNPNRNVT